MPMDNESCAKGIVDYIIKRQLQDKIVEYLGTHDYSNKEEVRKIELLMQ